MTKLLTDDDVFGSSTAVSGLLSDDDVFGNQPSSEKKREAPTSTVGSVARDITSGVLQIAPTAIKGVADIARLATGDRAGVGLSNKMEADIKTIQNDYGSERSKVQRENFQRDMGDEGISIGDAILNNKGALADQILPTMGSMILPIGVAGAAGKLATVGKAIQGMDKATISARVLAAQAAAGIGTVAAQNASDTFAELVDRGIPMQDAYIAAGITVPFSVVAGKLTGGGAEQAIIRAITGSGAAKVGVKQLASAAGKEGAQEMGEELGQITGEAVGTGEAPTVTAAGKRMAVAGTLGAIMGGGVDAASQASAMSGSSPDSQADISGVPPGAAKSSELLGEVAPLTEAEKSLYQPKQLTALDRVNEIDTALPSTGEGDAATLIAEREALTKDWPKAIPGTASSFTTEAGARVDAQYALIEAGDLQTSHDENMRKNPLYPQDLQPRERDRAASEMQVSGIVQKLDPARLGESADASNGAPIIGADGLVESGNARTIALKRVYQANGQKAADYKQFIKDNADRFGIDQAAIDGMQKPVLVRVRTTPVNRAEFARQANASTVAQMSPSEQARADSSRIDDMSDLIPDDAGDFSGPSSRGFVSRFMARLPSTEQSGMIDSAGRLSQTGYARVRNAVLAKAYGDSPVLLRMVESMDDNLRNVSKALMKVAPQVAKARQAIGEGALFDADITADLMAAVAELSRLKDDGRSVKDALAQQGMFGGYSAETRELLAFLDDNIRRPKQMAEFIQRYFDALEAAGNPNQGSLLGETVSPAKSDLMNAAKGGIDATENTERPDAGKDQGAGQQVGNKPADAQRNEGGAQGDETSEWVAFPADSGTLGIPRAEMPQVKGEHRGALIQFLDGKGITHETVELAASDLKPTQAEFSTKKAGRWQEVREGTDRSVLSSADGYILDGHHQWIAALAAGEPVKAIRFDAPIKELLAATFQFPSAQRSEGATVLQMRTKSRQDFKDALADLAQIASKHTRAAMMPENTPGLMPTLVKLSGAAIAEVGYKVSDIIAHVKKALRSDAKFKTFWNKIDNSLYRKAAEKSATETSMAHVDDLFAAVEEKRGQLGLFDSPQSPAPKVAMIDGRPYDQKRDNYQPGDIDSFVTPEVKRRLDQAIEQYYKDKPDPVVTPEDRAKAEALLKPALEKANAAKVEYDQKIIDITKKAGAIGQMLADVKGLKRAVPKLVDYAFSIGKMRDLLRSTIVVNSYDYAQSVVDLVAQEFDVMRIKNLTDSNFESEFVEQSDLPESGYRNVLINVRMPNGTIAEIQINTPSMLSAKYNQGRSLYEVERDLPEGNETRLVVEALESELYLAAASFDMAQAGGPLTKSPLRGNAARDSSSSSSPGKSPENWNTLPSGKRTKSSPPEETTNSQPLGNSAGTFISATSKDIIADGQRYDASARSTQEQESVIDVVNANNGEGLTEVDQIATVDGHSAFLGRLFDGGLTIDEFKAHFESVKNSKSVLVEELGKKTKPELLKLIGGYGAERYKNEKKDQVVNVAYRSMLDDFVLGDNISYSMGAKYEDVISRYVGRYAQEDLQAYADRIKERREERLSQREDVAKSIADPKTVGDFDTLLRAKKTEGMSFSEARMSLTPEQRAEYDRLRGIESRDQRKARADQQKTDVRVASQTTDGQIVETKHTKTGEPLFVVKAAERVERDVYALWNATAKRMGGYYSSFRGNGAVPGFQFKTRDSADAFLAFIGGNAEAAKEVVQERRDAFADGRSQSAVERLNEMADRLEDKASESLGRERKANTERRARFAASAESAANAEMAMAKTVRRIASEISDGTTKFLDRVRQKAQVEYLASTLRTAKGIELRTKYPSYVDQQRHEGEPATGETADYAEFPQYAMMRSDLANLARKMVALPSMKMLGQRILKVADDTSTVYNAFAKEHLLEVSRFGKADGSGWATFSTLKDAERSIEVSNLVAVAVPLQIKRGEYRIVLSPSEAINRGVWKGDDRKIFLAPDVGAEIVEKLGRLNRKHGQRRGMDAPPEAPWQFENAYNNRKRLAGMGIEQPWEFRAALREFANLKEAPKEADKIKAMERAMIGRKNDGLDFFPTPAETAQAMIDAAEITEGMSVLEPSAGMGHIAEQIRDVAGIDPDVIEFNSDRRELLEAKGFNVVGNDFMELTPRGFTYGDVFRDKDGVEGIMRGSGGLGSNRVGFIPLGKEERQSEWRDRDELTGVRKSGSNSGYDRIIMNPPFSNRRDAEHVQRAYSLLKPGGRVVAIMGEGVFFGQDKKAVAFREWLDEVGGTSEKLEDGTFLDPSLPVNTATNARMVVIEKPAGDERSNNPGSGTALSRNSLASHDETINIESVPSPIGTEDDITEAERIFLSSFPAGTRTYRHSTGTARSAKSASVAAGRQLDMDYRATRTASSSLGKFTGYETRGKVTQGLDGKPQLFIQVFGKEQLDAGLDSAPALSLTVEENGEFSIYGPPSNSTLYKQFERRGWAEPARDADGEIIPTLDGGFWTKLSGSGRADTISLLGDAHARAIEWLQVDHMGLHWKRTTGATGTTIGREGAVYFSRGNGSGMAMRDLSAVVDRVSKRLKNLPKVHVLDSPAALSNKSPAQKALRDFIRKAGAWEDVEGATHDGEIYLFASGLADESRAEHVLAVHEVTHYGLRGAVGKALDGALQEVWTTNTKVRKAAATLRERYGLKSNIEATEEILAEMAPGELVKLMGWRRVVKAVRDWLQRSGFDRLATHFDTLMKSGMNDQEKADQLVADLVNAARDWVRNGKGRPYMNGTRLADGSLAEDVAKQEKWLTREAKTRGYDSIDEMAEKNYKAFENLATLWREKNPVDGALLSLGNNEIRLSRRIQSVMDKIDSMSTKQGITGDSGREYSGEQRRFFKNVGRDTDSQTVIGRTMEYLRNDFWKKMATGIVDQFRGLRDLNDGGQAYMLARLSKGTAGAVEALLHHGKLSINDGAYDADQSGGFVERLGVPLHGELDDFMWWVAANRAEKLSAEEREHLFTADDIKAGKSLATGSTGFDYTIQTGSQKGKTTRDRAAVYADANRVFNEFQKNALDMAEQSGLIDGATRKYWESEFYVPFYRVSEEEKEFVGAKMSNSMVRQQAFKQLKGGTDKLNSDLLSNTLLNWAHLIEASAKNRAAKASLTAAEKIGAARKAKPSDKAPIWFMGEITKNIPEGQKYTEEGVEKVSDGTAQIRYIGKVEYVVDDPFVLTALTSLEYAGMRNPIMNALTSFKHWLTIGVTASPAFKIRNLIRDSIQAIGTSDLNYNPAGNVSEGYSLTNGKTAAKNFARSLIGQSQEKREFAPEYVSALASGGLIRFGTMLEGKESDRVRQLIKTGVKDSSILDSESKWRALYDAHIDPVISAYNELGNVSEEINRAALYNQLVKQGKSHADAALMARDLMDFSMQGSFNTIRFLTQVVPFMNARLQGLYKLGRAARDNPHKMATVTGAVALASIALMLAYGDDDDWKRREDWDRDNFWWFKFAGIEYRIPKPFEIGAVASLAERSLEYMINDEMTGERFRKVVSDLIGNNLSMNPVPQAVKPILDLYANKDSFTGRPIESMSMQRLDPTMRYNSSTSMTVRGASKAMLGMLSPVQIDHLVRGYFGWLGSFANGASDMALRAVSDEPTKPALDYFKFTTQGILKEAGTGSSRYLTMVYDQAEELEKAHATYRQLLKEGKKEEADDYKSDNADKLRRYRMVNNVKQAQSKLNERIRAIERGKLSADEKKAQIEDIQKRKEEIAKRIAPGLQ